MSRKTQVKPQEHQRETSLRGAFSKALRETPTHSKLTGRVFNKLCTSKGVITAR